MKGTCDESRADVIQVRWNVGLVAISMTGC